MWPRRENMSIVALTIVAWLCAGLASVVALGVQFARHRTRGLGTALLVPLGAALMFGFVSCAIGVSEGVWAAGSPGLWAALALGGLGVVCHYLGCRAVLRPALRPDQCPACGYAANDLPRCPECGRVRTR